MRERMAAAQALIKAGEYAQARQLLRSIDHPKAREWLARLDTIAPEAKQRGKRVWMGILSLLLFALTPFACIAGSAATDYRVQASSYALFGLLLVAAYVLRRFR